MIIKEHEISIFDLDDSFALSFVEGDELYKHSVYFDLEHYVYKKPKCIGVFGACVFENGKLFVTQYMIENKYESIQILELAKKYFLKMKSKGKKAIVTFSGNNDYTVINYLFKKYGIELNFSKEFEDIDIQREYEKEMKHSIGLKNLEKDFNIHREGEVISGSNLAKTFNKVLKDKDYILRMPKEKIETILLYNEQDVTNLYNIYMLWKSYVNNDEKNNLNEVNESEKPTKIKEVQEEILDTVNGEIIDINEMKNEENLINQEDAVGE